MLRGATVTALLKSYDTLGLNWRSWLPACAMRHRCITTLQKITRRKLCIAEEPTLQPVVVVC